jgi:hypothetical protein
VTQLLRLDTPSLENPSSWNVIGSWPTVPGLEAEIRDRHDVCRTIFTSIAGWTSVCMKIQGTAGSYYLIWVADGCPVYQLSLLAHHRCHTHSSLLNGPLDMGWTTGTSIPGLDHLNTDNSP